ncbi:unnamed protein product, partial [Schistosoma spindalis]
IDWNVLFKNVFVHVSYNTLEVIVEDKITLKKTCEILSLKLNTEDGRKNIHNMIVIDFLYKMRRYLKEYFEDFYPLGSG